MVARAELVVPRVRVSRVVQQQRLLVLVVQAVPVLLHTVAG
jgi:hypothetical protein